MGFVNTFLPVFQKFFCPGGQSLVGIDLDHSVSHNERDDTLYSCEFFDLDDFAIIGGHQHIVLVIIFLKLVDNFFDLFQCLAVLERHLIHHKGRELKSHFVLPRFLIYTIRR
jgi:hypothetical protein